MKSLKAHYCYYWRSGCFTNNKLSHNKISTMWNWIPYPIGYIAMENSFFIRFLWLGQFWRLNYPNNSKTLRDREKLNTTFSYVDHHIKCWPIFFRNVPKLFVCRYICVMNLESSIIFNFESSILALIFMINLYFRLWSS